MSHVVQITTEVRDVDAVQSACQRLHLPRATRGTFELYSSTETGLGIELPHWKYPVVANTDTGQLRYDNYNGRWGAQEFLDQFLQKYAVEKSKLEARKQGFSAMETLLEDGSIKVTIDAGGAE